MSAPVTPGLSPLGVALAVLVGGYFVVGAGSGVPENLAVTYNADRGRGTVYIDENDNGSRDPAEQGAPYAAALVQLEEAQLETQTQNLSESSGFIYSTFRFAPVRESEVELVDVTFVNPEAAGALLHQVQ